MSALSVAAVVVSHAKPDYLKSTIAGVTSQSLRPKHIIVVETASDPQSMELTRAAGLQLITPGDLSLGAAISAALAALPKDFGWVWLLHEDSAPEVGALFSLAQAAEVSPSVALIGPKLLHWEERSRVQQLGLTATRTGKPFLPVANEYDQGQHDTIADALATSSAGMLIAVEAWDRLGGFEENTPVYAADLELGLRARAAGYRVMIEPSARLYHAGLSMQGERDRSWTGGSRYVARSKAHIHIATTLLPLPAVVALYLAMPLIVLASIPFHLWSKRPGRILGQLRGWLWAWGTAPHRFAARQKTRSFGSLNAARSLLATSKQLRQRRLDALIELPDEPKGNNGIFASNQAWFAFVPLILSFGLWPQGGAYYQGLLPISKSWTELFGATAVTGLLSGYGAAAPSDPFNWALLGISAISPLGADWAIPLWLFAAPTLAFFVAWQFSGLFSPRPFIRTLVGLGYALSPLLLGSALRADLVTVTALIFAPLVLLFGYRAVKSQTNARALRWAGLLTISFFALAVSSPAVAMLLAVYLMALGVWHFRRSHLMVLSLIPAALALWNWVSFWITQDSWVVGLQSSWAQAQPLELGIAAWSIYLLAALVLAGLGVVSERTATYAAGLMLLVGLGALGYLISFSSTVAFGLATLIALAIAASGLRASGKALAAVGAVALLLISGSGVWQALNTPRLLTSEARLMPALVIAQSAANSGDVLTLKITQGEEVEAELIWGDGNQFEQRGLASKYLTSEVRAPDVAQLTAGLLAGNGDGLQTLIQDLGISFVLLHAEDPVVQGQSEVAISSLEYLQPAGSSEFGLLWRTEVESTALPDVSDDPLKQEVIWSLAIAALLALPTPAVVRGYRRSKRGER
ncbi:MAG: hypothetical protein RIS08_1299 [Actinomycetota bacterium]|jgi:GT2 family glycosyltransferase